MNVIQQYKPFFTSALLMCVVLCIVYPHYQYYIDPDGTAYLTIAERYARGDYKTAINGYWSPWGCWLTALFIKSGLQAMVSSVIVNAMGAIGFLYISQSFFLRFGIQQKVQQILCGTLALFLCYAIFWQSFDDLWECFFLLSALRIMIADDFKQKPLLWVVYGVIGTLAYFAKAYSFPFFILNTVCCLYFICKDNKAQWVKVSVVSMVVMIICSMPWIMALHDKYGIWTTSTSGSLNMSWYLVGHPQWKDGIDLLVPPAYKDSPYYWEDPYLANGATPHFWNSWHLFGLQFVRGGMNIWRLLVSMVQLSFLFVFAGNLFLRSVFDKKVQTSMPAMYVVALSFLLFPLGYLLVNFEARYIWYMLPLGMMVGGLFFQNFIKKEGNPKAMLLVYLYALSFLVYPLWGMTTMYDEGKAEYRIAEQLKAMNIHGSFTSDVPAGFASQEIVRIAYYSGNSYYSIPTQNVDQKKILAEMRRYQVKYYFAYESCPECLSGLFRPTFLDEKGNAFPEVTNGKINGLRVFQVN
ncbi:MAG: hypothetical protein JWQ38_2689 [Flavipsychrobacter sp.]|nr:hypothetical protein [Flavipsychrobacter sp.]